MGHRGRSKSIRSSESRRRRMLIGRLETDSVHESTSREDAQIELGPDAGSPSPSESLDLVEVERVHERERVAEILEQAERLEPNRLQAPGEPIELERVEPDDDSAFVDPARSRSGPHSPQRLAHLVAEGGLLNLSRHADWLWLARQATTAQPLTWVFTGDGQSLSAEHDSGSRDYVERLQASLRVDRGRAGDVLINASRAGETAQSLLTNLQSQALRFQPQAVTIKLGMTEALEGKTTADRFGGQLEQIVMAVRDADCLAILSTPTYPAFVVDRKQLLPYVATMIDVAGTLDVALIDHWTMWQQLPDESLPDLYEPDGFQLSAEGHQLVAAALQQALTRRPKRVVGSR